MMYYKGTVSLVSLHRYRKGSCFTPNVQTVYKKPLTLYLSRISKQKSNKFFTMAKLKRTASRTARQQILFPDSKVKTTTPYKIPVLTLGGKELSYENTLHCYSFCITEPRSQLLLDSNANSPKQNQLTCENQYGDFCC